MPKIKQGDYVSHYRSKEVYKVLSADEHCLTLIDAENRHYGTYPYDEVTKVRNVKTVKKWEKA